MEADVSHKRRKTHHQNDDDDESAKSATTAPLNDEESTDLKLAILSSLHSDKSQEELLEILLSCDGSVESALRTLAESTASSESPRKKPSSNTTAIGFQSSLKFATKQDGTDSAAGGVTKGPRAALTKKGRTLHLFDPQDIAEHTPCSIIHNFLPAELATALLKEILPETESFQSITFKLFDNVVKSPHTACFYVDSLAERDAQRTSYLYNGSNLDDVREILPVMRRVSDSFVRDAVNKEIATRIRDFYPGGRKLRYQCPRQWQPNAAFVNCYDGGAQSVGYHSDQLTYLGPRAVIGSLSLGVAREFRVRRIVPKDEEDRGEAADASGQIAIHLPHNSLLVMHAEMQEEWKHSVAPARSIDPHPVAGNKRINITYRWYREEYSPARTPNCRCGIPVVLKTVQKQRENRGRYIFMCQTPNKPGAGDGCGFFEWAQFTDDGDPIWKGKVTSGLLKNGSAD